MSQLDEPTTLNAAGAAAEAPSSAGSNGTLAQGAATGFSHYLFMHGSWFLTFGVQIVLFPYVVRVLLGESEIRLGFAQMAIQLPTLIFILLGGFLADRIGSARSLMVLYALAVVPFLGLGVLVSSGQLSYALVLVYAVSVGTVGAFAMPMRDALLSQVAPDSTATGVQKAVSFASLAQFMGQIIGMAIAASAALVGVAALLFTQAGLMIAATLVGLGLKPRPIEDRKVRGDVGPLVFMVQEIAGGLKAVIRSPVIGPVTLTSIAIGVCFMGTFMVILPLMVQNYFPADLPAAEQPRIASALAVFSLCFWVGTILTASALVARGMPQRKGRALLLALLAGATVLLTTSVPMPFWALSVLNFIWGMGAGVAMTVSRSIVQEAAPAAARARVLSVYNLGFMGGAPIGALSAGFLSAALGPQNAVLIPASGMFLCVFGIIVATPLWQLTDVEQET